MPPSRGKKNVKTFRWDRRLQIQNLFMAFKRVPDGTAESRDLSVIDSAIAISTVLYILYSLLHGTFLVFGTTWGTCFRTHVHSQPNVSTQYICMYICIGATEETTVTQQVSHRPTKCQSRLWSLRGTKVNGSHHGVTTRYSDQQGSKSRQKVLRLYKQWL